MLKKLNEFITITLGTLLVAIGVYFFKFPNNFSTGGVSGISVILGAISPNISAGTYVLIINIALLIIGFLFIGRSFGIKTVYSSLLLSFSIYIFERVIPLSSPLTSQPMLEILFAVILPAFGSALLFNLGASNGGTDIIAMILKKYLSLDIGKALFLADAVIATTSGMIFGAETGLFSIFGLLTKALLVDNMIESINLSKYFTIITSEAEKIATYINVEIHRGATICNTCEGSYSHEKRSMIHTVLSRSQAVKLRKYAKEVDPHAFIIITNTSDIIGKGFRQVV